jgi:hypothetical protein
VILRSITGHGPSVDVRKPLAIEDTVKKIGGKEEEINRVSSWRGKLRGRLGPIATVSVSEGADLAASEMIASHSHLLH